MPNARQRRDAQRRRLKRQYERRAQRDARRRRNGVIFSILGVLVVAAIVVTVVIATSDDSSTPTATKTTPATTNSTSPPATYPCTWTPSGDAARQVSPPDTTTPPKSGTVNLLVNTTQGSMTFQLNRSLAPCAVASFESLATQHYFDQTPCHRLTSGQFDVLQCGDPLGTGRGGPGYTIPDEATGQETYPTGTLAMARQANVPHSAGSQFFIVYKDSPALQQNLGSQQYIVFGKVTSGMNVVEKVAKQGSTPAGDGKPKLPITINSIAEVE